MRSTSHPSSNKEALIQRWQRQLHGRAHVNFQELMFVFRQRQLLETLFHLFDRDSSALLSESEWIGSIYKVAEASNRIKDVRSLEPYIHSFKHLSAKEHDSLSMNSFCKLFEETSFRREFVLLFVGETNQITVMEFLDTLRAVATVKVDTKWLSWLAYQCHILLSKNRMNNCLDLETFRDNFFFKVPQLAEHLFDYVDVEKTGQISVENLIERLDLIVEARDCEKVEILFQIFDHDGDGLIGFSELKLLLRCFLEQSPSLDLEETLAELTTSLFKETDVDQSGDISLEELISAFRRNEHLFKVLSLSINSWIQPKPLYISKVSKRSLTIQSWMRNHTDLVFFWSLYLFLCLCICIHVLRVYVFEQRVHFLVAIARINGGLLNFNCSLVLLLMLRKHITWLRTKGGSLLLPLDHHIDIHKVIGVIILIESLLHTAAHLANIVYIFTVCSLPNDCGYPCHPNNTHAHYHLFNESFADPSILVNRYHFDHTINQCTPFKYHGCGGNWNKFLSEEKCLIRCKPYVLARHSYIEAFFTFRLGLGYLTGVIVFILGAIFYVMCLPFVRKTGHFQLFYWCHMLTLPWLVIMLLHGPHFWKWLLAPGVLYLIEKVFRYRKSRSLKHGETFVMEAILLPSRVIHLVINRPRKFCYKPGDYLYINIPAIANFEWHPFSISSAPEHKDSIWLHLRVCGHWTRRVYELFRMKLQQEHGLSNDENSIIHLRTSMRSRMSKSYIEELRGSNSQPNVRPPADTSAEEVTSNSASEQDHQIKVQPSSMSLPHIRFQKNLISNHQSAITLTEHNKLRSTQKSCLTERSLTEANKPTQAPVKGNNQLSVPPVGDYCLRISNTPSMYEDEQNEVPFNETRVSDALGYIQMYHDRNRIQFHTLEFNDREDLQVLIDGPYGAPSQHIFEAEHAVLIAAGIGITPFASILQSIMCRYRNLRHKCPKCDYIWDNPQNDAPFVKKVDFIWVTREQRSLEWFISLLARMEIEQGHLHQDCDKDLLLNVHLYVTSAKSAADLKALNVYLSLDLIGRENAENIHAIDRIRQRTRHGRPNWDQVFPDLLAEKKGKISVFYCGPPAVSGELAKKCRQYGLGFKKELF